MARVVIVGGSGHVGTYLVPQLVRGGHEVINLSRGEASPYQPDTAWQKVRQIRIDRHAAEKDGTFGQTVANLGPDIVIDKICFTLESAQHLVEALRGKVQHFLHTGTIWVHGTSKTVPATETDPREPYGDYGIQKSRIEDYLLGEARTNGFPATVLRAGHIVGPGWTPLNPAGHFNPQVFFDIRDGKELLLPNFGLETVHHVHADDIAQMFQLAIGNWHAAVGEAFNTVSPAAITLRHYAEEMFRWFGHEPKLKFLPFAEWAELQDKADADATWEHISRSPAHSIDKARRLLGYAPRYSSFDAVKESVTALLAAKNPN